MRKVYFFIIAFLTINANAQSYVEIDGIKIEKVIKVEDGTGKTKLKLNGYGIRDKMWINLYTQALYLTKNTSSSEKILDSKSSIATRLHVTSSLVSKEKLIKAIEEGVEKSYEGDMEAIRPRLNTLMGFFNQKEVLEKNGYVDFVYSEETETLYTYINETLIGEIKGADFRRVLFGIWLEEKCVDKTLKRRLLGR
uniref:chalcone isomerase family protein n=1 Tax=Flavobacterium sp. TaxID=239 RepID=UPI004049B5B5